MLPKVQCECGAVFTYGEPHTCGKAPKAGASAKVAKAEKLAKAQEATSPAAVDRKAYLRDYMRERRSAKRKAMAGHAS